jgi:hypothetical protein
LKINAILQKPQFERPHEGFLKFTHKNEMHFSDLEASALFSFLATKIEGAKSGSAQLPLCFLQAAEKQTQVPDCAQQEPR